MTKTLKASFIFSLLIISGVIAIAEGLVMLLLAELPTWGITLSPLQETSTDTLLLSVIVAPLIWLLSLRPLARKIHEQQVSNERYMQDIKQLLKALDIHALVSITDEAGHITHVNQKLCEVSGYTEAELLGEDHRILKSSYHSDSFMRDLWITITEGKPWQGEMCNRNKQGLLFWVDTTIVPLLDNDAKPIQYISIRRDITKIKENEIRLLTLKRALDACNEMIAVIDDQGYIQYVNLALCHFIGWNEQQILGKSADIFDSQNSNSNTLAEMKSHLSQGKSWQGRLLYRRHANHALPDIYDYWVDVSITDIRNIQGKLIGYVQIQRDITDQVNTEQAQRLANADTGARLAISVVLHQALPLVQRITQTFDILFNLEDFHLQPQGGVLLKELDQDFLNIYVLLGNFSEEFIQLEQGIAYSDSLCGRASLSQKLIISDDCNCDQHRQHRLAHGHYIVPIQSAGTTLGILFLYTDPYPVQSESRLTMLQQVGDMLALALLQEQTKNTLELARDAAEQAAKIKAEFLANMSHEIRTPMNGVLGMLDILQDTDVTSEQQDLLKTAATSAESLLSIINDILDFSKLEAGKIELEHIEFNLPLLVEDVCSLMSGRAHAHNLELNCFLPPALPQHWHGDPNRIRQVLTNLIGNAVKFTDQGEVSVKVFLQETGEDDTIVRFEVKDTGIGLSPETQARLFQPFAQADSSTARRFGGTGLGLSISKNLINMMQGTIGVESELGNGACFWFSLPLEASHSKAVARVNDFNHKRVLIVDDNATNRKILSHYLVHCGMDVSEVDNAPAALLALEQAVKNQQAFDLLLSDLHMPDMDGYALAQAISNNPAIAATPRLLLSSGGFGSEADRVKLGFSQTLLKPVRQVQLFEAITNALQGANTHSLTPAKINLNLPNYSSKRLLVVEDNKVNQKVILAMLDKFQCVPDLAENGQVAIDKLAEQSYDLVLMDCQMPIMDGYEAIRILRGQELAQNRQRTPVVALTAHASNDEREKCLSAGMDNFLTKPVIKAELAKILAHWLGQSSFTDNQQSSVESIDDNTNEQMTLVWDKITTLKQLDYDSELLDDMINLFLMDIPVRLADLEQAVALNDVPAIAEAAHAIKGMAGHFFARTLSLHSANLEHSARQNAVVELSQLTKKVEDAAKDLIHAFEQRQSASV